MVIQPGVGPGLPKNFLTTLSSSAKLRLSSGRSLFPPQTLFSASSSSLGNWFCHHFFCEVIVAHPHYISCPPQYIHFNKYFRLFVSPSPYPTFIYGSMHIFLKAFLSEIFSISSFLSVSAQVSTPYVSIGRYILCVS